MAWVAAVACELPHALGTAKKYANFKVQIVSGLFNILLFVTEVEKQYDFFLFLINPNLKDAQEFSKLFMSLLEDTLSKQKNPDVRNIVQQQFCGEYAYVTV